MKHKVFPMNLQIFAENPAAEPDNNKPAENTGAGNGGEPAARKPLSEVLQGYTLEEIMAYKPIQSETDKRVTQGITTARTRWEAERAEETDEAARLAKMTEAQKQRYQLDKDRAAFEAEKAKFARQQLILETGKQMAAAGLPDLSEYITGKDAEETAGNLQKVQNILGTWKQNTLTDAMRGKAPTETKPAAAKLTRKDLEKMTPEEINEAWKNGRIDTKNL